MNGVDTDVLHTIELRQRRLGRVHQLAGGTYNDDDVPLLRRTNGRFKQYRRLATTKRTNIQPTTAIAPLFLVVSNDTDAFAAHLVPTVLAMRCALKRRERKEKIDTTTYKSRGGKERERICNLPYKSRKF